MEKQLIDAIHSALPDLDVFHDFAPESARAPFAVISRVGGAGYQMMDWSTPCSDLVVQITLWHVERLAAIDLFDELAASILQSKLQTAMLGAAVADYDADSDLRAMRADFKVLA